MICPNCGIDAKYYRHVIADGRTQIVERCPQCGKNPLKGRPFISPKDLDGYDLAKFPLWGERSPEPLGATYESIPPKAIYHKLDLRSRK